MDVLRVGVAIFILSIIIQSAGADKGERVIGFSVMSVADFKESWSEDGSEPLRFPPRSENAVIVTRLLENSPASICGLRDLDIIRVVNRKIIDDPDKFNEYLKSSGDGDIVLSVTRRASKRWDNEIIRIKNIKEELFYKLTIEEDKSIKGMHYHNRSDMATNARRGFYLYYLEVGEQAQLYLRMTYRADDWLFIKKYIIQTDENTYTITPKKVSKKVGQVYGEVQVWEWCDQPLQKKDHAMLEDIATSNNVTVRYSGTNFDIAYGLDWKPRSRVGVVLDAFKFHVSESQSESRP